ncbi:hypothetical protein E2562_038807 [Oryza meyeriana var. granulata]|uniref:Uncharacterized protein n=1 Tax=Oryza meyeriana var. granulata TaxID=110450 RepID=A0A6G1FGX9_9ORYZ|nr:hypothetical protein E2562_038807 [Oryza meyeriana var. granulata]
MAHNAEASGSSRPHDGEVSRGLGLGAGETGPKTWPVLGEEDDRKEEEENDTDAREAPIRRLAVGLY